MISNTIPQSVKGKSSWNPHTAITKWLVHKICSNLLFSLPGRIPSNSYLGCSSQEVPPKSSKRGTARLSVLCRGTRTALCTLAEEPPWQKSAGKIIHNEKRYMNAYDTYVGEPWETNHKQINHKPSTLTYCHIHHRLSRYYDKPRSISLPADQAAMLIEYEHVYDGKAPNKESTDFIRIPNMDLHQARLDPDRQGVVAHAS